MFPPRGRRLAGRRAVTIRARQLGLYRPLNSRNGVKNAKLYHHRERASHPSFRFRRPRCGAIPGSLRGHSNISRRPYNISRRRNMLTPMSELCLRARPVAGVPRGRARLLVRSAQAEDRLMMLRLHVSAEVGRLARRRVKVRAGERIASDDAAIPDPTQHLEAADKPS